MPILLPMLGGLISERSGVMNIGLEGMMLGGAFAAVLISYLTGNPWLGLVGAAISGVISGAALAFMSVTLRGNQVVAFDGGQPRRRRPHRGAGSDHLGRRRHDPKRSEDPPVAHSRPHGPAGRRPALLLADACRLCRVPRRPRSYGGCCSAPMQDCRIRACGESAEAADAAGIPVVRTRFYAVVSSGVFAALGGAYLSIVTLDMFQASMTQGRGFLALAAMVFGKWRVGPRRARLPRVRLCRRNRAAVADHHARHPARIAVCAALRAGARRAGDLRRARVRPGLGRQTLRTCLIRQPRDQGDPHAGKRNSGPQGILVSGRLFVRARRQAEGRATSVGRLCRLARRGWQTGRCGRRMPASRGAAVAGLAGGRAPRLPLSWLVLSHERGLHAHPPERSRQAHPAPGARHVGAGRRTLRARLAVPRHAARGYSGTAGGRRPRFRPDARIDGGMDDVRARASSTTRSTSPMSPGPTATASEIRRRRASRATISPATATSSPPA